MVDKELHFMITGTLGLLQSFLPLIRQGHNKKIVVVSSALGSIELATGMPGLNDIYSVTRAALNMLIRKWGGALKSEGITTAVVHPGITLRTLFSVIVANCFTGWVPSTEIGSGIKDWMDKYAPNAAPITTEESAAGVVAVIIGLKHDDTNSFHNYDGTKLPW
jgi:NAD(P)-dependent dehydrogenase (short-subunit alcohol dehydrogenase family)